MLTDRARERRRSSNEPDGNAGFDVKWGVRQTLVADLTVNTDFAQVEDDEAQVNLTRFNLQFPEKRDFFLEGADTFNFAARVGRHRRHGRWRRRRRAADRTPAPRRCSSTAGASA